MCAGVPIRPPAKEPRAQPQAKVAMRLDAAKSEKPMSCSHIVKKTIAFQGVVPTMPCESVAGFRV